MEVKQYYYIGKLNVIKKTIERGKRAVASEGEDELEFQEV